MSTRSKPHLARFAIPFLLALGLLAGGMSPPAFAATQSSALSQLLPQGVVEPTTLLIHGVSNTPDHLQGGCDSSTTWGPTESLLTSHGVNNYSLGYYKEDGRQPGTNCGDNIYDYELIHGHCTNYFDSGSDDGTWNDHDVHVACELAWYIWDNFTALGAPVNLVGHSLGGVLIKEMLYQIYVNDNTVDNTQNPGYFPPYLLISHIVTIASPLAGVPLGGQVACSGCLQVSEIQPNGAIYNDLTSAAGRAVGQAQDINWIMEGQAAAGQLGCDWVGNSAFGMSYGFKVDYSHPINGISSLNNACRSTYDLNWYYGHGTYLVDTSTASDVTVNYCAGCSTQNPTTVITFTHSLETMYWGLTSYVVENVSGGGAFLSKWQQVSDIRGPLGDATSLWFSFDGGEEQNFQHGSIYWSSATGTYEVQNGIYQEYTSVLGCPNCVQGFPTSDELQVKNGSGTVIGAVSYFYGNLCGSRGPNNSGSAIYYSSSTGSHLVGGCIYNKYWQVYGGPNGNSDFNLGFPTSDVTPISGGYVSYFYGNLCGSRGPNNSGSAIYYSSATGGHMVGGCIYNKYWSVLGGPNGNSNFNVGYPTSDVLVIPGGYVSYFYGNLCGSRGPNNSGAAVYNSSRGTYLVGGCIYNKYWQMGTTSSALGFPTTDVYSIFGGSESDFAGTSCGSSSGSTIQYSSSTGAHEIQGCIYQEYLNALRAGHSLSFPTSDEQNVYNSSNAVIGRENTFSGTSCGVSNTSGSAILWSSGTGAHEVQGCIYHAYVNFGGAASALGLPISDEYTNSAGQRESDFQGGNIIWANNQAYINLNGVCC